ncbi:MAG: glycosyltransferase [bacterium]|nr:glycosyltransferase [bacterium]
MPDLKKKKIFVGFNNAGSEGIYSFTRILRKEGFRIDFFGFSGRWVNTPCDVTLRPFSNKLLQKLQGLYLLISSLFKYDIFHFFYGRTFFQYRFDHFFFKLLGKKVIYDFRGSELYDVKKSVETDGKESPYYSFFHKKGATFFENEKKRNGFLIDNADAIVLAGPWLASQANKSAHIIPYSRNIEEIHAFKKQNNEKKAFTILHAPTKQEIKGTKFVTGAVEELKKEGMEIELTLVEKVQKEELFEQINRSDIVVDQLLIGWYGGFSVEAMALEKPVVCYLEDEYKDLVPFGDEIPIINASKDTLKEILKKAISEKEELKALGKKGYEFVQKYHDAKVVAKQYQEVYESVL